MVIPFLGSEEQNAVLADLTGGVPVFLGEKLIHPQGKGSREANVLFWNRDLQKYQPL